MPRLLFFLAYRIEMKMNNRELDGRYGQLWNLDVYNLHKLVVCGNIHEYQTSFYPLYFHSDQLSKISLYNSILFLLYY